MVEQYLADDKLSLDQLAHSIQALLDTDEIGARAFETLVIFTEVVPLIEEQFHLKELVLLQLRMELQTWHRRGKFQRLSVTIPSEQFSPFSMSRGDLQIQVSASKPTIVAGQEFSVFVVIGNPFEVPIVLYSVETQIPVELVDIAEKQIRRNLLSEDPVFKRPQAGLWNSILRLTWDRWRMNLRIATEPENRIAQAVAAPEITGAKQAPTVTVTQSVGTMASDSRVIGAQIERYQTIDLEIDSVSPKHLDNLLWRIEAFKKGMIPIVLQPGDSVVKQFIFRTKSWLFFTPLPILCKSKCAMALMIAIIWIPFHTS
jgi:hypothetical protein